MLANQDSDLRPELVKDFPKGGVLKYHPRATGKNLKVLELLGIKYIIILRHPIDQMAAAYCDALNPKYLKGIHDDSGLVKDHIYPYPEQLFRNGAELDGGLNCLLCDGYLTAVLTWMTDWLRFRDRKKSLIVTYEDFILRQQTVINNLSHFLIKRDANESCLQRCAAVAGRYANKRSSSSLPDRYSRGWTGKIGVWKNYYSAENKDCYRSVVRSFLATYPHASLMLEVYPDLLDVRVEPQ
jgi:hypothetical protein